MNPFKICLFVFFLLTATLILAQDTIENLLGKHRLTSNHDRINKIIDMSDVYLQSDPAKAIMLSEQALTLSRKMESPEGEINAYVNMGLAYYYKGDTDKAITNVKLAQKMANEFEAYEQEAVIYKYLSIIYSGSGQDELALEMKRLSLVAEEAAIKAEAKRAAQKNDSLALEKALNDTILAKVSQEKMDVLKETYDYKIKQIEVKTDSLQKQAERKKKEMAMIMVEKEEKDKAIKYLMEDAQLKEMELSRQKNMLFLFIVIIGLILILFFVLLNMYRFKNQALRDLRNANIEISLKNEELLKAYEKLEQLARTDPLTQLSNRRDMMEKIEYEQRRCDRSGNSFVLCISDIDHFKSINDTYGHDAGDYVLVEISKLMTSMLRKQDIVARWGGEEFLLFFPDTPLEGGVIATEKVRQSIAEHRFEFQQQVIKVTMTLGLCEYNQGMKIDACLKKADQALYRGKQSGRNQVRTAAEVEEPGEG